MQRARACLSLSPAHTSLLPHQETRLGQHLGACHACVSSAFALSNVRRDHLVGTALLALLVIPAHLASVEAVRACAWKCRLCAALHMSRLKHFISGVSDGSGERTFTSAYSSVAPGLAVVPVPVESAGRQVSSGACRARRPLHSESHHTMPSSSVSSGQWP